MAARSTARFNHAFRFVINELPNRLNDADYRAELETSRGWDVDPERHLSTFDIGCWSATRC